MVARSLVLLVSFGVLAWSGPASAGRLVFEEVVIEGEVQKPEITVVISRENLNKSYNLELKESFLPKIIQALDNAPF